jgi:hypothetical protein
LYVGEDASYVDLVSDGIDNLLKSVKTGDASVDLSTGVVRNKNAVNTPRRN